jgi:probable HAF family extracellular repeat protein
MALGTLGGQESWALAANQNGAVAGASATAGGAVQAFVHADGSLTGLGTLGGSWSAAYGLNSRGQAVGAAETAGGGFRAFLWEAGAGLQDLGTLGGRSSYAFAINDNGQVAGHPQNGAGYFRAFLWDPPGGMKDLGTLGGRSSYAYGINNAGYVVGYSWVEGSELTHAFLFAGGVMVDLNSFFDGGGWTLTEALAINDLGQIVGAAIRGSAEHAFRLDPFPGEAHDAMADLHNPEPGTLALVLAGFLLIWIAGRRSS